MMMPLLKLQLKAAFGSFFSQNRKKGQNKAMTVLMIFCFGYLGLIIVGMMFLLFSTLAVPYHSQNLDWLYFSTAGLIAIAFSVFGCMFTAQNVLFGAKDNDLLLAMPIKPQYIVLSRMVTLLIFDALFSLVVIIPAGVVYGNQIGFTPLGLGSYALCILAIPFLVLSIISFLGWLLNLLLRRINPSIISLLYMVLFLVVYFYIYSQAGAILHSMVENSAAIGEKLTLWAWPLYAMGRACAGSATHLPVFPIFSAILIGVTLWILSATFLKNAGATAYKKSVTTDFSKIRTLSPIRAITNNELARFLFTPAYLTNTGSGIIFVILISVLGLVFRDKVLNFLSLIPGIEAHITAIICGALSFMIGMTAISCPSVALEGQNIWILKSMPVSSQTILKGKLRLHCLMLIPVALVTTLILTIAYGCPLPEMLLAVLLTCLIALFSGVLGMVFGLRFANLDWVNEITPCKQSAAMFAISFSMMGLSLLLVCIYLPLSFMMSPVVILGIIDLLLAGASWALYRVMLTYGAKKWDSLY